MTACTAFRKSNQNKRQGLSRPKTRIIFRLELDFKLKRSNLGEEGHHGV
jgi:hypothetical protein